MVEVVVKDNGRQIASGRAVTGESVIVDMPSDIELWSPENPKLYDLEIKLMSDGKTLDKVDRRNNYVLAIPDLCRRSAYPAKR